MNIFRKRRGYWPMGERFAAFFRGPTVAPEDVRVEIRDSRPLNVSPIGRALEPLYSAPYGSTARLLEESAWIGLQMEKAQREAHSKLACGDFHPDKDLPDYCEGCTQPKTAHREYWVKVDFAELEARVLAWINEGPSAQHRAECDCAQFYGEACKWPACGGAFRMPDPKPTKGKPT